MLFQAHSGLRYLVLLAGLAAVVVAALGWQRRPAAAAGAERPLALAFVGLLDLQALLGIVLLLLWTFYGQLMGHIVTMILAVALAHIGNARAKKAATPADASKMRAIAFAVTLLLIAAGILSIGRPLV